MQSRRAGLVLGMAVCVVAAGGCVVVDAGHAPGTIQTLREPDTRRDYRLYVPSYYSPDRVWPVVVTCHASRLLDKPAWQIDEWKALAESKGFLVVAPDLTSAAGDSSKDISRQLGRLRQDEAAILAVLAHVRAARNVDTNAVFIAGWMGGAYPALSTGMRHPDIFRAIALRQPAFDARFFETCLPYLDVYQPVFVLYGMTDLARDQSIECADWLRENRVAVTAQELGTANKRQPEPLYAFLRGVVRTRPWIRVLATEPDASRPLAVQFAVRSSVPIETYEWSFGDGGSSAIAAPEHTYANEGSYAVQVTVGDGKKRHVRRIEVSVPRARLGIVPQGQ